MPQLDKHGIEVGSKKESPFGEFVNMTTFNANYEYLLTSPNYYDVDINWSHELKNRDLVALINGTTLFKIDIKTATHTDTLLNKSLRNGLIIETKNKTMFFDDNGYIYYLDASLNTIKSVNTGFGNIISWTTAHVSTEYLGESVTFASIRGLVTIMDNETFLYSGDLLHSIGSISEDKNYVCNVNATHIYIYTKNNLSLVRTAKHNLTLLSNSSNYIVSVRTMEDAISVIYLDNQTNIRMVTFKKDTLEKINDMIVMSNATTNIYKINVKQPNNHRLSCKFKGGKLDNNFYSIKIDAKTGKYKLKPYSNKIGSSFATGGMSYSKCTGYTKRLINVANIKTYIYNISNIRTSGFVLAAVDDNF